MKAFLVAATMTAGLIGAVAPVSAQYYGGGGGGGGYGYGYDGPRERDRGYRDRGGEFSERDYLRCNPDVRRAVNRGQFESGWHHFRTYGRREGRRLDC